MMRNNMESRLPSSSSKQQLAMVEYGNNIPQEPRDQRHVHQQGFPNGRQRFSNLLDSYNDLVCWIMYQINTNSYLNKKILLFSQIVPKNSKIAKKHIRWSINSSKKVIMSFSTGIWFSDTFCLILQPKSKDF